MTQNDRFPEKAAPVEADILRLLDCSALHFTQEDSGFLTLDFEGKTYHKVSLTRLIPFYSDDTFVSVSYKIDETEFREIGVIKDIRELSKEQFELVDRWLRFKYYAPTVTRIHSIKDNRMGYLFVDADTTSGRKTICINDWFSNFRMISKKMLSILDVDGNRYYIPDVNALDKKSLSKVELFV